MEINVRKDLYRREKYLSKIRDFYSECEIIKVITGVRRCGKSSIMNLIIDEIIKSGVSNNNILYFNLDSREYNTITTAKELDLLIEKNSEGIDGIKYLFIDEVQNVKNFEIVINAWREEGDFSIFITGSNSYLLSGELITKLTGRYIEFNVYPFSFDEYVNAKVFFGKKIKEDYFDELIEYIHCGGFPYLLHLNSSNAQRVYIQNLIDEIYEKDVRRRIRIKNRSSFEQIMKYVINNYGMIISIRNIENAFMQNGMVIKRETIERYIRALVDAKVIIPCERFDMKSRKSLKGDKKYYLADLSFYYALNTDNRINFGPCLENIVFIYLAGKGYSISVGKIGNFECDFIVRDNKLDYAFIQVAYTILESRDTEDREYKSLEAIKGNNYPRFLLTCDKLLQKRNGIIHANITDFIINNREVTQTSLLGN